MTDNTEKLIREALTDDVLREINHRAYEVKTGKRACEVWRDGIVAALGCQHSDLYECVHCVEEVE